jgi:hypothetical protein
MFDEYDMDSCVTVLHLFLTEMPNMQCISGGRGVRWATFLNCVLISFIVVHGFNLHIIYIIFMSSISP